ncbi:TonB-dependent receptor [Bacteroides sp. 224]|uniref:TonB-dependent receptor n=1 Tax=Bacteroides sp. 224 TaxID=2302936 RepID=UPI0013D05554|nr:TonB-dependent receptor [Bacteroides sp. 224]NDV65599.1 TonB-dependent receptor [Bacteroides sp. 224]
MTLTKTFRIITGILLSVISISVSAQNYRVTGLVSDAKTAEALIGVSIYVEGKPNVGTTTDSKGRYNLSLSKGSHKLHLNYMGYEEKVVNVSLVNAAMKQNIQMLQTSVELEEVVVTSRRTDANVTDPQVGVTQLELPQLNKLPVLMGERDIIKSLELMPGVKSAGEGSSGFFVRGGTSDQNLIMLDNVSIYNASHLMGFFSTFNSDVIRDAALYKGPIPAQYGERLSAILDVQQRNGDMQNYGVSGGIGLISSKLNVEGPIQKGKSSFLLGARRTYADAIARLSGISEAQNAYLYFYDLNMKLYFALSDKDQLSVSGYLGRDKMVLKDVAEMGWGNAFLNAKWTRNINPKWLSTSSLQFSQYSYGYDMDMGGMQEDGNAKIRDYGFKHELQFTSNANSTWRAGLQSTYHDIAPGDFDVDSDVENNIHLHHRYSWENGLYLSNQLKLNNRLELLYGLRLSTFSALGKGEYYKLNEHREVTDSIWHGSGKFVKTYINLEPRMSAVYKLNATSSVKGSYARTTQNMHLLTYVSAGTPFDRWTSSSNNIKPQIADQFTLGYFRNFGNNVYEFSVEAYYKDMRNQLDFKDHAEFQGYDVIDTEVLVGKGRAYGVEFMLKKRTGRLNGWLSYTLAKSEKKINGINEGNWYDAYQDRTHDISLVGIYELNRKWTLSAAWVYYTGNAITYPSGKYQVDGKDVMYYAERNGYRAPAYHRLDLGATCLLKKTAKFESELAFSLYNAYGRKNAYMIQFRTNDDDPGKTSAYRYSLFTYVPSISWNFKF